MAAIFAAPQGRRHRQHAGRAVGGSRAGAVGRCRRQGLRRPVRVTLENRPSGPFCTAMSASAADASAYPAPAAEPAPERPPRPGSDHRRRPRRRRRHRGAALAPRRAAATTTAAPGCFRAASSMPRDRDCACGLLRHRRRGSQRAARARRGRPRLLRRGDPRVLRGIGPAVRARVGDDRRLALDGEAADRLAPWRGALHRARARHRRAVRCRGHRASMRSTSSSTSATG